MIYIYIWYIYIIVSLYKMAMSAKLYIRPVSWSSVTPSNNELKQNPTVSPYIQFFGYTQDNRSIYVRLSRKSTFILKFTEKIDNDITSNIFDILSPTSMKTSDIDPTILIVRAPEVSPKDVMDNDGVATWTDVKQDPYGEVESLWESLEIGPYEWLSIDNYFPIPGKTTSCDINIRTEEEFIHSAANHNFSDIFPRLFIWDIETFASKQGEFTNSSNPDDFIFMISIITVSRDGSNAYVIVKGDVNLDLITQDTQKIIILRAKDEEDLLTKFFDVYGTFRPDREIYYNGDMFDMPYLIDRMIINNIEIPKVSKILTVSPKIVNRGVPTPFGMEIAASIDVPGTESIDLLHYYRRFYPYMRNHRLDTVAKTIIGRGKTGLTIDEMMEVVRLGDPNEMAKVVDYSFVDSLRLFELWNVSDIQNDLESVCNNLGVDINSLLRLSLEGIIDHAVYNIDAGSAITRGKYDKPTFLKEAVRGIYRNVSIYDYSELYRQMMLSSGQVLAATLGERLEGAPPKLILTAFYSNYIDRTNLLPKIIQILDTVIGTDTVIAIEPTVIRSIRPLKANWLKLISTEACYVSVAKASYLTLGSDGEIESSGLARLCRPKFQFVSSLVKQYITLAYSNNIKDFKVPDLKGIPRQQFILSERIGDISQLDVESVKYKLLSQHGAEIDTWMVVKYVMTNQGPVLLSKLTGQFDLDYNYYRKEIAKYVSDLETLKVYGV
jgi:DNA polymerase elongation subunit (family B)